MGWEGSGQTCEAHLSKGQKTRNAADPDPNNGWRGAQKGRQQTQKRCKALPERKGHPKKKGKDRERSKGERIGGKACVCSSKNVPKASENRAEKLQRVAAGKYSTMKNNEKQWTFKHTGGGVVWR